jgi:MFS family permease
MNDRTHGGDLEGNARRIVAATTQEEVDLHGEPLEAEPLEAEQGASLRAADRNGQATTREAPDQGASRRRNASLVALALTPGFLRLWGAQVVSNVGDWAYVLAVATAVTSRTSPGDLPRVMALILAVEGGASALTGMFLAGPIADRFPRRRVMVIADLARAIAVASLLAAPSLSPAHLALVALVLGVGRSLFQPALMSSLPTLVRGDTLMTANALVTGTFHAAIMVGPMVGAALVATIGPTGAFALNAASFVVSAALLAGLRLPRPTEEREPWSPIRDLVDGGRSVLRSPVAFGVTVSMALVLFLVAWQKPLEIGLVRRELAPEGTDGVRAAILGAFTAAWGVGMVAGSALAPFAARRRSRQTLLSGSVSLAGLSFLGAAVAPVTPVIIALWALGGVAAGVANVSYETLLQEHTPDAFLGRTFATVEAAQDAAYFLGAVAVGAVGGLVTPEVGFGLLGGGFLLAGIAASRVLRPRASAPSHADTAARRGAPVAVAADG